MQQPLWERITFYVDYRGVLVTLRWLASQKNTSRARKVWASDSQVLTLTSVLGYIIPINTFVISIHFYLLCTVVLLCTAVCLLTYQTHILSITFFVNKLTFRFVM